MLARAKVLILLLFGLVLAVCACDDEPLACTRTEQCESRCGSCAAACLPTGPQGAGECHCSCDDP